MGGTEDKAKGQMDEMKGRAQKATGDLTGNENQQAKGQATQTKGKVKKAAGDVENAVGDLTDNS